MKIIIKIIIYYIITFNFISTLFYLFLTFVRTKRRRYCNNIKQDFTIFYVQIIIFEYRCAAGIYYYLTLLGIPKERRCDKEDCRILRK